MINVCVSNDDIINRGALCRILWWFSWGEAIINQQTSAGGIFEYTTHIANLISSTQEECPDPALDRFIRICRCAPRGVEDHGGR